MALLEKIVEQLQDPAPEAVDPENWGDVLVTGARLATRANAENEDEAAWRQPSLLRQRAALTWDGIGKKTSRKELYSEDDSLSEVESDEENQAQLKGIQEEEEEEEAEELEEGMLDEDGGEDGDLSDEEIESDLSDGGDDGGGDVQDDDEEISSSEKEDDDNVTIMQQDTAPDGGEKAEAVVQQLDLWDRLMELRIQLQKIMFSVNTLSEDSLSQQSPQLVEAQDALRTLGSSLYELQHGAPSSPKKRKADTDLEELASQSFESLRSLRDTSLTFWDEKTRLASKKFKSFKSYQTPILKQVEQILSDRDRLIRRTQVLRSYEADQADVDKPEEIFDDNDFYQRMLKSVIESKADEESSISASASQWLQVKKKKKKDIDTRASKGRKLRYNVHKKLVNFMAPRDNSTWSEEAKDELFKNLFKMPGQPET